MENKRFRVGSIAVLFTVVVLCVAIFGCLTVATANSDIRTARRYAQHVSQRTQMENLGQAWLSRADAWLRFGGELPENAVLEGDELKAQLTQDTMKLDICLKIQGTTYEITRWSCTGIWQPDDSWNLWH